VGCYIWHSEDVPNVTAHPSKASVPITVLLYNDPLLCGFNVPRHSRFGINTAVVPAPIENFFFISKILYLLAL